MYVWISTMKPTVQTKVLTARFLMMGLDRDVASSLEGSPFLHLKTDSINENGAEKQAKSDKRAKTRSCVELLQTHLLPGAELTSIILSRAVIP